MYNLRQDIYTKQNAEDTARSLVADNLRRIKYKNLNTTITFPTSATTFNGKPFSMDISTSIDMPIYLLDKLLGLPNTKTISSVAKVKIRPVLLVLVLDVSSSMGIRSWPYNNTRLHDLRIAANSFISKFADGIDIVSVVTFNHDVTSSMIYPISLLDKNQVINFINSTTPAGGTNIQNALREANIQISNGVSSGLIPSNAIRNMILFTDGYPTSAKDSSELVLPNNSTYNPVSCNAKPSNSNFSDPTNEALYLRSIMYSDIARDILKTNVYSIGFGINEGYQRATSMPNIFLDPYQDITLMDDRVKSNFLARLANKKYALYDFDDDGNKHNDDINRNCIPDINETRNIPDFNDTCVPLFDQIQNSPIGEYYETISGSEIDVFFSNIASKIFARLAQ